MNSSCVGADAMRPHANVFLTLSLSVWKTVYYSPQGFIKQNNGLAYYQDPAGMLLKVAQVINGNTRWGKARSVTNGQLT